MGTSYDEWLVHPGVQVWQSATTGLGGLGEQRILPDGCLDLIFDGERLFVAGPDTAARVHHPESSGTVTGVRLHAGRGPALLGVPAHELSDRTWSLDEVWGTADARRLVEQVAVSPVQALEAWAVGGLMRSAADVFGERVHGLLGRSLSVSEVADAMGYSARQLHRRSLPVFGYGPQHLGRVLRMLRALAEADAGHDWAGIAQRAGYVDQAHLTRDFRALAGATPTELRRERDVRSVQDAA